MADVGYVVRRTAAKSRRYGGEEVGEVSGEAVSVATLAAVVHCSGRGCLATLLLAAVIEVLKNDEGSLPTTNSRGEEPATVFNGTGTTLFEAEGSSLRLFVVKNARRPSPRQPTPLSRRPAALASGGKRTAQLNNYAANVVTLTSPTIAPTFTDLFAATPDGQLNTNWLNQAGDFALNTAGNMAGVSTTSPNLAVLNGVTVANVSESVGVVNLLAGQTAALIARYQGLGNKNLYYGGITRTGNVFYAQIYKNINGVATALANVAISATVFNGTGTIQFEVEGSSLRLFVVKNGTATLIAQATDTAITAAGSVGIWSNAAAQFNTFSASTVTLANPSIIPEFTDIFAATPDGQLDTNWLNQAGDFNRGLLGTMTAVSLTTANVAVLNNVEAANVAESVTVTSLLPGQTAGLVARYQGLGDANYYLGAISRSGNAFTAQIYKNIKGVLTLLTSAPVAATVFNGTGTLEFEVEGASLRLFIVNSQGTLIPAAEALDTSITAAGSIGFRGAGNTQFSNYNANAVTLTTPVIAPTFADNFAPTPDGQLNANWLNLAGNFGETNGSAIGQVAGKNVAVLNGANAADVSVQANIDLTAASVAVGSYAGLVARYAGPLNANMYLAFVTKLANGRLQPYIERNLNGTLTVLSTGATVADTAGTLTFQVEGSSLKLFLNGTLISFAQDTALKTGSVGMYASSGAAEKGFQATLIRVPPQTSFADNFSTPTLGNQLTTNWIERAGNFTVNTTTGTATGQSALNEATVDNLSMANTTVQANATFTAAGQYLGLLARYSGPGDTNGYLAQVVSLGAGKVQVYLMKNTGSGWVSLATKTVLNFAGGVKFQVIGNTLSLTIDGNLILSITDKSIIAAGSVGVRSSAEVAIRGFSAN